MCRLRLSRFLVATGIVTMLVALVVMPFGGCSDAGVPGMPNASEVLKGAWKSVKQELGIEVKFSDIRQHPNEWIRQEAAYTDYDSKNVPHIWLRMDLNKGLTEALAGHELAHVVQDAEGWPNFTSQVEPIPDRIFVVQEMEARITSLVHDPWADNWAVRQGLQIDQAFKYLLADTTAKLTLEPPNPPENWEVIDNFVFGIADPNFSEELLNGLMNHFLMANEYAANYVRFKNRGLDNSVEFKTYDEKCGQLRPLARQLGTNIAEIIMKYEYSTPEKAERTMTELKKLFKLTHLSVTR